MLRRPTQWVLTTGVLACVFNTVGCQSTGRMQGRSHAPVSQFAVTPRPNLTYPAQMQSPYHVAYASQTARATPRSNILPVAAVARGQNPEVPPSYPATLPDGYGAGPYAEQGLPLATARQSPWARCKQKLQACFLGYPEEFGAPPLGHSVYLNGKTQVENGEAARMVLYQADFEEGGVRLTWRGRDQLVKIAELLPRNFFPVVIERTPDAPELAEARRMFVLQALAHGPFPVPPERILVSAPPTPGLRGVEAEVIYRNQIGVTRSSGSPLPTSQDVGTGVLGILAPSVPGQQ